jgi:RNA polymerase sigma-70 factor, ECF subfamily
MEYSHQQLINGIKNNDVVAFEELYKQYYIFLCLIAEHIVRNPSDAEEIVSDVFVRLWNIRGKIEINTSVKGYLVKAVYNTSFNFLEHSKMTSKLTDYLNDSDYRLLAWDGDYPLGQLYEKEVIKILDQGIDMLPVSCKQIFMLSRNENMKYCDIAVKLGISVNTVKTQMKIALSRLREALKDYLKVLLLFTGI